VRRRALLEALAAAVLASPASARAREYAFPSEVFDEIDRLATEVDARLGALAAAVPGADAFARSVASRHAAHRRERDAMRARLGAGFARPGPAPSVTTDLAELRTALQDLVHAHAEGLPALGNPEAVDLLARHMVERAAQLTVVDLWIDAEASRV
jgi:hypothetical protein